MTETLADLLTTFAPPSRHAELASWLTKHAGADMDLAADMLAALDAGFSMQDVAVQLGAGA